MTSTAQTALAADTSDLLDLTPADAGDVLAPVTDLRGLIRHGQAAVSATDTHVKHLFDAFSFGAGLGYGLGNAGGAEFYGVHADTSIVPHTVLGGFAATIDLTAIPTTYEHLRLVLGIRTAASAILDDLLIRCNGDAGVANYASLSAMVAHSGSLTTAQALEGTIAGGQLKNAAAGGTSTSPYQGVVILDFYEYGQMGRPRTCHWRGLVRTGNTAGLSRIIKGCFMWKNTTAAINRLTVVPASGFNLVAGSGYALYGIR